MEFLFDKFIYRKFICTFFRDLIAFIALTIDVCTVSIDTSLWLHPSILSDNDQNRVIIQKIAAVNWDDFRKVIDIRVVNLSA